jgi:capsule polysaccharide export protein KpsE/RkpR
MNANLPPSSSTAVADGTAGQPETLPLSPDFSAKYFRSRLGSAAQESGSLLAAAQNWVRSNFSFWLFFPIMCVLSFGYFYLIAEQDYVSVATISLKSNSTSQAGLSSFLGGLANLGGTGTEDATLAEYIQSPDMLARLDKKFNLRQIYSSPARKIWWRMSPSASAESFLSSYQSMIDIALRHDVSIMTLSVADYDASRAKALNQAIIAESERFMNEVSRNLQEESVKFARMELNAAMKAVQTASLTDRAYAEQRLQTATQSLAAASGLASQQAIYIVRISNPSLPTQVTKPAAFLDSIGMILIASALYIIGSLLWANVTDHRRM